VELALGGEGRPPHRQHILSLVEKQRSCSEQKAASARTGKTTSTPRPGGGGDDDGKAHVRLLVPEFVGHDGTLSPVLEAFALQLTAAALSGSEVSAKEALKALYETAGTFITEMVVPELGEPGQYALSAYGKAAGQSAGGEASMGAGGFERVDGLPLTDSEKALIKDCATLAAARAVLPHPALRTVVAPLRGAVGGACVLVVCVCVPRLCFCAPPPTHAPRCPCTQGRCARPLRTAGAIRTQWRQRRICGAWLARTRAVPKVVSRVRLMCRGRGWGCVCLPLRACVRACVPRVCRSPPPPSPPTPHTHKGKGTGVLSPAAVKFGIGFLKAEKLQSPNPSGRLPNGFDSRLLAAFKQQFSAEAAELATFYNDDVAALERSFAKRIKDHAARKQPAVTSIVEILSDSDCEIVEF
jgi:hypothetical protein